EHGELMNGIGAGGQREEPDAKPSRARKDVRAVVDATPRSHTFDRWAERDTRFVGALRIDGVQNARKLRNVAAVDRLRGADSRMRKLRLRILQEGDRDAPSVVRRMLS